MDRPENDSAADGGRAPATGQGATVAPEDERFEHQIKRFVAEREARRAARPGLYR